MTLRKLILALNACYKAGKIIIPKGVMIHSTGANNPYLSRYVGPDDGMLGYNKNNNHWNQLKPDGRTVCVHAFIGKLADGSVATYQTLPWTYRAYHCGRGKNGSANNTHISVEICEDGLTDASYFQSVYKEAAEFCVMLCGMFNFNPLASSVIIGHYEGYKRGIASNHGDPRPWFIRHGKSMDTFRADVNNLIQKEEDEVAKRYNTLKEIKDGADWAFSTVDKMLAKRILLGNGAEDNLNLSEDMMRILVMLDRAGVIK